MSTLPPDPFGRTTLPAQFDRRARVALLRECATALLEGRQPSREASLFLGGAISSWLQQGGSLEKDFLQTRGEPGSHATAQQLAARLEDDDSPTS